jgi:hypothetical protein
VNVGVGNDPVKSDNEIVVIENGTWGAEVPYASTVLIVTV